MKNDQELAESMAEFCGIETSNGLIVNFIVEDGVGLIDFFFDPSSEHPNPKGFPLVWDKLEKEQIIFDIDWEYFKPIVCSIELSDWFREDVHPHRPHYIKGRGPTRVHAIYAAVDEMRRDNGLL